MSKKKNVILFYNYSNEDKSKLSNTKALYLKTNSSVFNLNKPKCIEARKRVANLQVVYKVQCL